MGTSPRRFFILKRCGGNLKFIISLRCFLPPKTISKSRYLAGLQCPKRLWLEIHRNDLKDEVDQDNPAPRFLIFTFT